MHFLPASLVVTLQRKNSSPTQNRNKAFRSSYILKIKKKDDAYELLKLPDNNQQQDCVVHTLKVTFLRSSYPLHLMQDDLEMFAVSPVFGKTVSPQKRKII